MAFGNQLGPQVLNHVEAWVPSKAFRTETKFRDDLMTYLEAQLNSGGGGIMGQQQPVSLRKERGKSRADIAVDDDVGIELKRAITDSKLRRLRDQLHDLTKEYSFVIVCACGVKETGKWNELRQDFENQAGGLGMGMQPSAPVRFVEKRKDGRTFTGGQQLSGGGPSSGGFDEGNILGDFDGL